MLAGLGALAANAGPVIAVHGGAGTLDRARMTPEREAAYHEALRNALAAGHAVLTRGNPALDAVTVAVTVLEDSPLFNAGRGAVYTWDGAHELDASIMDGATARAGAVGGVRKVRNPILLARRVMEDSPHVFLAGRGAEAFARDHAIEFAPDAWFHTDERREQWEQLRRSSQAASGALVIGTVGAVALDKAGNLAAGTSTGGMTGKRWGRLGDSPVIGAGTWADPAGCAVSATGHGEYFIRLGVAHEICARVRLGGETVEDAAGSVIHDDLGRLGGTGGVIVLDAAGRVAMPFNTDGMYRGVMGPDGEARTAIYADR
jgi:beta-aspartyl-peptidase (threonine type)